LGEIRKGSTYFNFRVMEEDGVRSNDKNNRGVPHKKKSRYSGEIEGETRRRTLDESLLWVLKDWTRQNFKIF